MLLPLLRAGRPVDDALRADAVALGVAMQLTNILRDVGEDWDAGRVYLPAAVMEEAGLTRDDLAAHRANAAFRSAWERVARRSEELYLPLHATSCGWTGQPAACALVAVPVPGHHGPGARRRL